MKQFEYKVIAPAVNLALTTRQYEQQAQELEKLLNTLGAEGTGAESGWILLLQAGEIRPFGITAE